MKSIVLSLLIFLPQAFIFSQEAEVQVTDTVYSTKTDTLYVKIYDTVYREIVKFKKDVEYISEKVYISENKAPAKKIMADAPEYSLILPKQDNKESGTFNVNTMRIQSEQTAFGLTE
jgi:hypothetical protein